MAAILDQLSINGAATMPFSPPYPLANYDPPARNPSFGFFPVDHCSDPSALIEISDYLAFDEGSFEDSSLTVAGQPEKLVFPVEETTGNSGRSSPTSGVMNCGSEIKRIKVDDGPRIGFRTKSEVEILDDGFKWRKYGKKSVKNSPNPRNYYRCSSEGCCVKKRVERDREDSRYVITTYDGVHNHLTPGAVCYSYIPQTNTTDWVSFGQMPSMVPNAWTMQAVHNSY